MMNDEGGNYYVISKIYKLKKLRTSKKSAKHNQELFTSKKSAKHNQELFTSKKSAKHNQELFTFQPQSLIIHH
jgi:hypothetical protein